MSKIEHISIIETKQVIEITPKILAEAFWNLGSDGQAKFFEELYDCVEASNDRHGRLYGHGEIQWCYMMSDIRKNVKANKMYMALSAFAFDWFSPAQRVDL